MEVFEVYSGSLFVRIYDKIEYRIKLTNYKPRSKIILIRGYTENTYTKLLSGEPLAFFNYATDQALQSIDWFNEYNDLIGYQ